MWSNIVFAYRCYQLYRKIKEARNTFPDIFDEETFSSWIDKYLDYMLIWVTHTGTEVDDMVMEQAAFLIQDNWDMFYSLLTGIAEGKNPSITELTKTVSLLSETSKTGNATIIAVLLLITNITELIQKRDKKILKRMKERREKRQILKDLR